MRTKIRHYSFLSDDAGERSVLAMIQRFLGGKKRRGDERTFRDVHSDKAPVIVIPGCDAPIPLTNELTEMLHDVASELLQGKSVTVISSSVELTTQDAADILGISRPTLIRVLESGAIPFHTVGRHRRVQLDDVLEYQHRHQEKARVALDELAADEDPLLTLENPLIR
ncbi:hypothetical protein B9G54_05895 [Alloscardovia macacae]|uniref:Helix-turn-helix domain-containing protein n=1 Tax=Alloscardovia macacae TaxID=1160091 RepID=A0A1Y2ST75_9BIFI|nr:helix-turn-helix domain-containing protein [Alloscardovia macacae]OTA26092.1 hypothetical protein B9G54_05895 [Alloscardovia macacae]OTA28607.1 hypothetical protein B9T39_06400 [Alloscardovia macacae]